MDAINQSIGDGGSAFQPSEVKAAVTSLKVFLLKSIRRWNVALNGLSSLQQATQSPGGQLLDRIKKNSSDKKAAAAAAAAVAAAAAAAAEPISLPANLSSISFQQQSVKGGEDEGRLNSSSYESQQPHPSGDHQPQNETESIATKQPPSVKQKKIPNNGDMQIQSPFSSR